MYIDINSMESHKALQLRCYWASVKNALSFYFKVVRRKNGDLYYINLLVENEKEVEHVHTLWYYVVCFCSSAMQLPHVRSTAVICNLNLISSEIWKM